MATDERQAARTKRPWYLILALLICSGLGACGSTDGWRNIEVYRGVPLELPEMTREEDRQSMQAAADKLLAAMDAERSRLFPMSVAELVLGIAMFVFAAAAMTGRGGARRVLVQLVAAQAVLVLAMFLLTPKLRWAPVDILLAQANAKELEHGDKPEVVAQNAPAIRVAYRGALIAGLALRTVLAGLVIVALTRQRSRQFYEAAGERPNES